MITKTQIEIIKTCFNDFVIERFNITEHPNKAVCTLYKPDDLPSAMTVINEFNIQTTIRPIDGRVEIDLN